MNSNAALRRLINSKYKLSDFKDKNELMVASAILFTEITGRFDNSTSMSDLIDEYADTYRDMFEEVKETYISYPKMIRVAKEDHGNNILDIKSSSILKIAELYKDKRIVVPFNILGFSPLMYKISDNGPGIGERLHRIHVDIMSRICSSLKKRYNIKDDDISIVSCEGVEGNPGKSIEFYVNGLSSSVVYSRINITPYLKEYIYNLRLNTDGNIVITTKI